MKQCSFSKKYAGYSRCLSFDNTNNYNNDNNNKSSNDAKDSDHDNDYDNKSNESNENNDKNTELTWNTSFHQRGKFSMKQTHWYMSQMS